MKQEEINKRLKEKLPFTYYRIKERFGESRLNDLLNFFYIEISLAVKEREEQIFSRLKELGCGDAVNVIEMELNYKPTKQK